MNQKKWMYEIGCGEKKVMQGSIGIDIRKCGFSYKIIKDIIKDHGIIKIKRIIKGYKGIPFIPDSLHIKGIKRLNIEKAGKI